MKICLIIVLLIANAVKAQDLNELINRINTRYSNIRGVCSYDIYSKNKSLISDTVKYSYNSHVLCNGYNQNDSIKDFISTLPNGNVQFAFLNNELLKHDTLLHYFSSRSIESPYSILKRGEFKWAVFTPFVFKKPLIDTLKWNESISDYSISKSKDTIILEMCNTFVNKPFLFDDDPAIGSSLLKIKIHEFDTLIYFYEETINISKKPDITTFIISNYKFDIEPEIYRNILNTSINYFDSLGRKKLDVKSDKEILSLKVDLKLNFTDSFIIYDLFSDSTRVVDLNSRYYIIDFWFFGCIPCIKASRLLNNLVKNGLPSTVEIIGINFMNKSLDRIKDYVEQENLIYNQYYLKSTNEINFLEWYGAPTIVIYDRERRIVIDYFEGFNDEIESKLVGALKSLKLN